MLRVISIIADSGHQRLLLNDLVSSFELFVHRRLESHCKLADDIAMTQIKLRT